MPESHANQSTKTVTKTKKKTRRLPHYHVVLWDDNAHSYEYVMAMLRSLFGFSWEDGYRVAKEVDFSGHSIVVTTSLEHAELKRDQIHSWGPDDLIEGSAGSMWCTIERAASQD
jgi:ATP-dependent Clp protease adaptor protein ClpS